MVGYRTVAGRRLRWSTAGLLCSGLIVVAAITPAVPASASTTSKPYAFNMTPTTVAGGQTTAFSATFTNETGTQQLGSANITPPSTPAPGFTVAAASIVGGAGTAAVVGNVVQLRGLNLSPTAPNNSVTVTFSVTAPCAGGVGTWAVEAKQSNNFSGPPGNNLSFDSPNSSGLMTTVNGSCHLAFVTEPTDTTINTAITTQPFNAAGGAIQVAVEDGNNNVVTSSTAPIALQIGPDSPEPAPNAALTGGGPQNASSGVAAFNDLTINTHGIYDLQATSPGLASATSTVPPGFEIWDQAANCQVSCSGSVAIPKVETSQGTAPSNKGFLLLTLGQDQEPALCANDGFHHAPDGSSVSSFGFDNNGMMTVGTLVVDINKSQVQSNGPNNGAASYQVCFQDGLGNVFDPLPTCKANPGQVPCLQSVTKTQAGDVIETITTTFPDTVHFW
jgi:hypothetical protein